jgi:hypothetical protein
MQRTFITVGIVSALIVGASQALAYIARFIAHVLTLKEKPDDEVTTSSTTASLLRPLVVTLPMLGGLIALQRAFTGAALPRSPSTMQGTRLRAQTS